MQNYKLTIRFSIVREATDVITKFKLFLKKDQVVERVKIFDFLNGLYPFSYMEVDTSNIDSTNIHTSKLTISDILSSSARDRILEDDLLDLPRNICPTESVKSEVIRSSSSEGYYDCILSFTYCSADDMKAITEKDGIKNNLDSESQNCFEINNSKPVFLIVYDLDNAERRERLYTKICNHGEYHQAMSNACFIQTNDTANDLYAILSEFLRPNEHVFIVDVTHRTRQGWLGRPSWDWLKQHEQ